MQKTFGFPWESYSIESIIINIRDSIVNNRCCRNRMCYEMVLTRISRDI